MVLEKESQYTRPENLLESMGINFKGLDEEEREMKKLLMEEYKKSGKNLLAEIKKWRGSHPEATLGDSIRALYEELER
ncbi:MAG: hypothetical protein A2469_00335 [Candidatus Magasanikbacteria bacterium RIFOXYC2_FULL_40_16]|uniref:Uncharacterized protein n=3 Tax=Candidatus Magasanikiibacteriota TaxID=1752731 RepID=A0A1F6NHY0_9BACT|nr:MAG: hypothetical protein A2224_00145 [Candidatus Magasanikbacteria bacterium RIFOXYA2_FULL_40_20]OGH83360.1 MAG: hypothetical protein A2373_00080 [Candidatus Magasanikbacteria bacterium RIFOXYB1_FULL_40_15]OGH86830.1 MAG: hypothetical protein A2301_02895 [Candidatus Magasanikbacteria bacterium RIFOXYB2_FULL_40_13]OGH87105.1 MAG: hypothetical protein A2206_01915 [Candidatus Magasanikbacteria bacterium RIFOXYA1_FULL_40_8]OGH90434.1 MAG: hypothetical protein A2469_00335 [Candidatus Magasanikba